MILPSQTKSSAADTHKHAAADTHKQLVHYTHQPTQEMLVKINDCNAKLDIKRIEIEQLLAHRTAVAAEFEATIPDTELFKEQLAKIFNRWVSRSSAIRNKQPSRLPWLAKLAPFAKFQTSEITPISGPHL